MQCKRAMCKNFANFGVSGLTERTRRSSSPLFGLWSTLIGTAAPPRHRTALQSPTFAHTSFTSPFFPSAGGVSPLKEAGLGFRV